MVDFLLFMAFSILEGIAVFYLMFKAFRFQHNILDHRILLINFIVSLASYFVTTTGHQPFVPASNLVIMIPLVSIFFGVNYIYSMKMTITTYVLYMIINAVGILILPPLGIISSIDVDPFSSDAYIAQTFFVIMTLAIAQALKMNRLGYTYVPVEKIRIRYNLLNRTIFIIGTSLVVLSSAILFIAINDRQMWLMISVVVFAIISLATLVYISIKKEYERHDRKNIINFSK